MDDKTLNQHRIDAAIASKGTSPNSVYRMTLQLLETHHLRGALLEFGAGMGSLISELHARGYQGLITGVDIMPKPAGVPDGIVWALADLNEPTGLPEGAYDVVVSTEVIEHLENPRAVFREFHRLLAPGGTLVVTTPNQESLRSVLSLALEGHFAAFKEGSYPAHITALVRKDLERVCLETGFAPPEFAYDNSGSIPKFPWLRWEQFGLGGRLFSDGVAIVTRKNDTVHLPLKTG